MKRFVLWAWVVLSLARGVSALYISAHAEDWPDGLCYPDSVFVHWLDSQNNEGWSYGRVRGPEGSPSVYSFSWCSNISESQYIPVYSFISELCVKLNTGVEQYWPLSELYVDCDPAPFPIDLPFGTFNGCEAMETGMADPVLPQSLQLEQNYPNPFNPNTNISFYLPFGGQVQLVVRNLLGQQVAEIVNDQLTAGNHERQFSASNLSSGLYLYTLTFNGQFVMARSMLLVK